MILVQWEAASGDYREMLTATSIEAAEMKLEELFQTFGPLSKIDMYQIGEKIDSSRIQERFIKDPSIDIPGLDVLTPEQLSRFETTYQKHMQSMDPYLRTDYMPQHIEHVEYKEGLDVLVLHLKNGNWVHYGPSGVWY